MNKETSYLTTGIGSLPHHNVDSALEFAFKLSIPFMPQIPIRHPAEFMLHQALAGFPGLTADDQGMVHLETDPWRREADLLDQRLAAAFEPPTRREAFEPFAPPASSFGAWRPFLFELEERGATMAKIQLAGPLTCQWALKADQALDPHERARLGTQIFRFILARSLAMALEIKELRSRSVQPLFYFDEPGLFTFDPHHPVHVLHLRELKFAIQALRKEGITVGLHCCSNTHWPSILDLELDVLSFDVRLSLRALFSEKAALERYLEGGGRLSFGVIPTGKPSDILQALQPQDVLQEFEREMKTHWPLSEDLRRRVLREGIYTPACGLALHKTEDAESVLTHLLHFAKLCREKTLQ